MTGRDAAIEVGLWHNGSPISALIYYQVRVWEGSEWSVTLPSRRSGSELFTVRGRWAGEIVHDWVGGEMWLLDKNNVPIGTPRPFLTFLGVSDLPMTTVFPSLEPYPLFHAGIWVVTTRAADSMYRLKERAGLALVKPDVQA